MRQWFYDKAATAVHDAVILASNGKITNRQKVTTMFPETNPSMDSYRIGTILELVRAVAIRLAEENLRIRVCVQDSMVRLFLRNQLVVVTLFFVALRPPILSSFNRVSEFSQPFRNN